MVACITIMKDSWFGSTLRRRNHGSASVDPPTRHTSHAAPLSYSRPSIDHAHAHDHALTSNSASINFNERTPLLVNPTRGVMARANAAALGYSRPPIDHASAYAPANPTSVNFDERMPIFAIPAGEVTSITTETVRCLSGHHTPKTAS